MSTNRRWGFQYFMSGCTVQAMWMAMSWAVCWSLVRCENAYEKLARSEERNKVDGEGSAAAACNTCAVGRKNAPSTRQTIFWYCCSHAHWAVARYNWSLWSNNIECLTRSSLRVLCFTTSFSQLYLKAGNLMSPLGGAISDDSIVMHRSVLFSN